MVKTLIANIKGPKGDPGVISGIVTTSGSDAVDKVIPLIKDSSSSNSIVFKKGEVRPSDFLYLDDNAEVGMATSYSSNLSGTYKTRWCCIIPNNATIESGTYSYLIV